MPSMARSSSLGTPVPGVPGYNTAAAIATATAAAGGLLTFDAMVQKQTKFINAAMKLQVGPHSDAAVALVLSYRIVCFSC